MFSAFKAIKFLRNQSFYYFGLILPPLETNLVRNPIPSAHGLASGLAKKGQTAGWSKSCFSTLVDPPECPEKGLVRGDDLDNLKSDWASQCVKCCA